jgi:hypothetical protein
MKNFILHQLRRAWAILMAPLGVAEYKIAFKLGFSIDELRLNFAADMQHASLKQEIRIRRTLETLAASGRHPSATIYWMKRFYTPKSESKNTHKSNQNNDKETYATEMPPGCIIVRGPNGETE